MLRSLGLSPNAIAVIVVVVIANLGNTIVAPVLPDIRDYFGCSAAEVGLIVSGFGLGRLVMDLPAGILTGRVSATRLFTAGILVSGGAAAAGAFSTTLMQLVISRTVMGLGSAVISTVALVMMVNMSGPNERGRVLAFYTSAMLFGSAVSPILGGYLATLFDWRAIFLFCALTPLATLPLNMLVTGRATEKLDSALVHGKPTARRVSRASHPAEAGSGGANWPALIVIYLSTFLNFFNRQGMQSALLPLYAGSVLGMDPTSIGGVLSSRAIFTIVIMLPAGALADRVGRKLLLIPGMLMLIAGNLYLLTDESVFVFTLATFLISAGVLANNMLSALIADLVPERMVGKGMGMYRFTCDLGTVLGPFALGLIVDHSGFAAASISGAAVILVGVVGCALLVPGHTTPAPAPRPAPQP